MLKNGFVFMGMVPTEARRGVTPLRDVVCVCCESLILGAENETLLLQE